MLAERHVTYGVMDGHYKTGQALVDTLERGLGDTFTTEVREAWLAAYAFLSTLMIASVEQRQPHTA